ncbi:3-mercaptopyruvate sulfurtransferase [Zopfochytrium polystomum]|nr:3-mercaptopyruvate sulfurtransferase [Zopfochytrium polystomum]
MSGATRLFRPRQLGLSRAEYIPTTSHIGTVVVRGASWRPAAAVPAAAATSSFSANRARAFSTFKTIAQPLVSISWLEKNFDKSSLVVLDGTWHLPTLKRNARKEFEDLRIKGARFFDIDAAADKHSSLPHMIPSAEEFAQYVGALGISNDSHVVVYDATSPIGTAPRVLWTFRAFGHSGGISVLDGGLQQWKEAGLPVESGPVAPVEPKEYVAKLNPRLVKNFEEMRETLKEKRALIIDARPRGRFTGADPEPRPISSGHMPGSISLPSGNVLDPSSKSLLRGAALSSVLMDSNIDISHPSIIHTCGSGVNASTTWLATVVARMDVAPGSWEELEDGLSVYDGSWTEWAQREKDGAVIEKD